MARSRDAVDTIKGYYYQFDYFIFQLISLVNEADTVTIEGIEDVDILEEKEMVAVQCKYYAKTEYNHSVIAKPIRLMLKDYVNRTPEKRKIRYKLYGKYQSGQDKYPGSLSVEFAKKSLFTYTEKETPHILHEELNLTDEDIEEFLSKVDVDINAEDYYEQQEKVISNLEKIFQCERFEAEYYYYNNALRLGKEKAVQQKICDRIVSKREFLDKIDNKKMLFRISGDREKAENILNSFDGISNVTCVSSENDSYDFEFDNAMAAEEKKKMFFAFAENEIPILMQKEIEPSLEDIFLKLTDNTSEKEENTNESDI